MSVRQKSLLRVTISTKRNLLPPCERGRLEKGSLLFLIILNFTPSLSPPLLLPPLKFSVESLSAGHASPVTWCLKYTTRMVAYPHLSTHSFWNIRWNDLIFCTGALLSMWLHCWKNQDCVQDTVRLNQLEALPVTWCLKDTTKSIISWIINNYAWKWAISFICFFLSVLYYFWIPPFNWTCRASNSPATYTFVVMI